MDIMQREVLKLSEALLLCQRELAQVREAQEPLQEQCSRLQRERDEAAATADQLAQALAGHLSSAFWKDQQPTVRIGWARFIGSRWPWLKRLFGTRQSAAVAAEQVQIRMIESSPLFDAKWYLGQNPDVAQAGINPATHFLRAGASEGRNPGPDFDVSAYMASHPGLAESGVNPLLHQMQSVHA
jgi:hypothetical protein